MISIAWHSRAFLLFIGTLFVLLWMWPARMVAQILTDTLPHNKNAVLEEFTAVRCYYCPLGHCLLDSMLMENPGRIVPLAMYPSNVNGLLTVPYTGSPDLRRTFVNEFFTIPFVHDSLRFFPGAFINRRQWQPARREQSRENWRSFAGTILSEPSPVNIGISAVYDQSTYQMNIGVEIYFTDTVNTCCTLFVVLTEDSLIAEQYNGGVDYVHNHVFREALCSQWGDTLCLQASEGTLIARQFVFDNSQSQYAMDNCHIAVYVRNAVSEEIITGNIVAVDNTIVTGIGDKIHGNKVTLFPNPSNGKVCFNPGLEHDVAAIKKVKIFNSGGALCFSNDIHVGQRQVFDFSFLKEGLYLVYFETDTDFFTGKLIID